MNRLFQFISDKNILNKKMLLLPALLWSTAAMAQPEPNPNLDNWQYNPGVIGTVILLAIVLLIAVFILYFRVVDFIERAKYKEQKKRKLNLADDLVHLDSKEIDGILEKRKAAVDFKLSGKELGGDVAVLDQRGVVADISHDPDRPLVDEKKRSRVFIETDPGLKKIVLWYLAASVCWLVIGTSIGQYVGMKFVWPEMDTQPWLSFSRLRPVHTNTVFWGWASLAMVGLGHFVIARTSNTKIWSKKLSWLSFAMINLSVIIGDLLLMSGVNNGGGEYREYIWPVAILFGGGLIIVFYNFYKTVASRKVDEIYISNWYLLGGLIWTITLYTIGYIPFFQEGLGETVIQGYFMHQGVGMWFMTFTLGLIYYYLPSSLNKPIYSYSLGVLAFWTQMLFYTLIGTHHFIFSPLPWWLQTVAIVFSAGMFIPVVAGSTNFMMTMRGTWHDISKSYTLPFFLVGVVFYFVGSTQGSLQAFRFTNFIWHFNDFNVAHSHMTMYGIICFILWACIYTIVPKITGREPKQVFVGMHFWLAFIGLFAYMTSLMIGGTERGFAWVEGKPFIESVILMAPYWVWRAVGGSLMFVSHLIFAYNFYVMTKKLSPEEVSELSTIKTSKA
ncbi:MAG TPA: cbb3-type cytochrome c oxidase subunit I [Edaphocola sp.]|nr:cbb3-type cytochrome c oxidase subunit I [Edaphocola sp.]